MPDGWPDVHYCEVCCRPAEEHKDDPEGPHGEVLPLCCPGCSCGSYEEAALAAGLEATPPAEPPTESM